jgi:hypothetical protein
VYCTVCVMGNSWGVRVIGQEGSVEWGLEGRVCN